MSINLLDIDIISTFINKPFKFFSNNHSFVQGIHRNIIRGISSEFLDYKQYQPGDDIKYVDWRLFARSDRLYLKHFENESKISWVIILDNSASMEYSSNGISKFAYSKRICANLSYLLLKQGDYLDLFTVNKNDVNKLHSCKTINTFPAFLQELENLKPVGKSFTYQSLFSIISKLKRNSRVILLSDFFVPVLDLKNFVNVLDVKKINCMLLHLFDKNEMEFDFRGASEFEDLEDNTKIVVDINTAKKNYMDKINEHLIKLKYLCESKKIRFVSVPTYMSLKDNFLEILK